MKGALKANGIDDEGPACRPSCAQSPAVCAREFVPFDFGSTLYISFSNSRVRITMGGGGGPCSSIEAADNDVVGRLMPRIDNRKKNITYRYWKEGIFRSRGSVRFVLIISASACSAARTCRPAPRSQFQFALQVSALTRKRKATYETTYR